MLLGLSSGLVAIKLTDLIQIFVERNDFNWTTRLILGLILALNLYVRIQFCQTRSNAIYANIAVASSMVWLIFLVALMHFFVVA